MKVSLQGQKDGVGIIVEIEEYTVKGVEAQIAEIQKVFGVKLIEVTETKEYKEAV